MDEYALVVVLFYCLKLYTKQSNKDATDNHSFAAVKWNGRMLIFRMQASTEWIDLTARFSCLAEAVLNGLTKYHLQFFCFFYQANE